MKTVKVITPAVRDACSSERNDGKERLCGPRQDGWRDGSGYVVSPGGESCLNHGRAEI